jgi:hypothetical protein
MICYFEDTALAFVPVILTFQEKNIEPGTVKTKSEIGSVTVLLVLRKQLSQWKLLTATTDPDSTDTEGRVGMAFQPFLRSIPRLANLLDKQWNSEDKPNPAELLAPADGQFPQPAAGQRFGDFSWQPSESTNVVAEIVEFAYTAPILGRHSNNEARLFIRFRSGNNSVKDQGSVSAGYLWTTRSIWQWRVWSISDTGDLSISESRSFRH